MKQEEIYVAIKYGTRNEENHAVEFLFKKYTPKANHLGYRAALNSEEIKCIIQETMIDLIYKIKSGFELTYENSLDRYVLKSIKNRCFSAYRKSTRTIYELPFNLTSEDDGGLYLDQDKLIEKVFEIAGLSGEYILRRRFLNKLPYSELAEELDITPLSAKNTIYRVIKKIRGSQTDLNEFIVE